MIERRSAADHQEPSLGDHPEQLEPASNVARPIDRCRAHDDDVHAFCYELLTDPLSFHFAVAVVVARRNRRLFVPWRVGDDAMHALSTAVDDPAYPNRSAASRTLRVPLTSISQ